jgi:hypothetical protein
MSQPQKLPPLWEPSQELKALLTLARETGQHLRHTHLDLTFSPGELEWFWSVGNREGRFRHGPVNWELVGCDPGDPGLEGAGYVNNGPHTYLGDTRYDAYRLAKLLGGPVDVRTEQERMTARVLTDSQEGSTPEFRFHNARCWVQRAYDDGVEAGKLAERSRWEDKIRETFGVSR